MLTTLGVACLILTLVQVDSTVIDACTCAAYGSFYAPNSENGCKSFHQWRDPRKQLRLGLNEQLRLGLNEQTCPAGLLFDLAKCYCNYPSKTTCPENCPDVNECASAPCNVNAVCTNTVGSFTCECNSGYTGDGFSCADVNECASAPCNVNAGCTNTVGSFTCECNSGYSGDGFSCAEDDCLVTPCVNGLCASHHDQHRCECDPGFTGTFCDEVDYCCGGSSGSNVSEDTGSLFDFGANAGDTAVVGDDDGWAAAHFVNGLVMFGARRSLLYIWYDGAITTKSTGLTMPAAAFPRSSGGPVIVPYWDNSNFRKGGKLWHRRTTDTATINSISGGINAVYGGNFVGDWALIVTWEGAQPHKESLGSATNTFQTVLVTDGEKSYVNFLYGDIKWTDFNAQVGIDAGDGENYYELPESRTPDIVNIDDGDNSGVKGKYMFRVSETRVVPGKACKNPCGESGVCTSVPESKSFSCA